MCDHVYGYISEWIVWIDECVLGWLCVDVGVMVWVENENAEKTINLASSFRLIAPIKKILLFISNKTCLILW